MPHVWATHSLLYEPGDRPSRRTDWSAEVPKKGHSQGVGGLEFQS